MRIALRTSGGRGEFEVAGTGGGLRVHDVLGRTLVLEILPGLRLPTGNQILQMQGKPRIRLIKDSGASHIYLILAAALLLPKPKRELLATPPGKLQIYQDNFSIVSIPFDVVELTPDQLVLSPTQIILSNSASDAVRLDVVERFRIVLAAWAAAGENDSPLKLALSSHRSAFHGADTRALLEAAKAVRYLNTELDDPLRFAINTLGVAGLEQYAWMGVHTIEPEEAQVLGEVSLEGAREAARNRVRAWRLVASRGKEGRAFADAVRLAYNNTCLFSGYRLPKTEQTGSPGVDAAHILPWAEYNLNRVSNGLCLNKLYHWAFDAGIIKLEAESDGTYTLSITSTAVEAEAHGFIDLSPFKANQGTISTSLLPKDKANWPDAAFLRVYNDALNL